MNRIINIRDQINNGTNDQEDMMLEIMDALKDTVTPVPEPGTMCTFVYNAKTPGITYDQHPLVAVTELFRWGFRGLNFHWQDYRQYTWEELAGQVYIIEREELDELMSIPYEKFVLNK